jgi:hypothetical protein
MIRKGGHRFSEKIMLKTEAPISLAPLHAAEIAS